MSPIDPRADGTRRAWLPCPNCNHGADCPDCQSRCHCDVHWQYLLGSHGTLMHLQCPTCRYLWATDIRKLRAA
jgi:hypothetical protein